jgi:hypothetical protein
MFLKHPLIDLFDKYNKYLKALTRFNRYSYMTKKERIQFLEFPTSMKQKANRIRRAYKYGQPEDLAA